MDLGSGLQQTIDELVRRIVAAVQPRRIRLFGSAARGEFRRGSDIDLLVIMPDGTHRPIALQGEPRRLRSIEAVQFVQHRKRF